MLHNAETIANSRPKRAAAQKIGNMSDAVRNKSIPNPETVLRQERRKKAAAKKKAAEGENISGLTGSDLMTGGTTGDSQSVPGSGETGSALEERDGSSGLDYGGLKGERYDGDIGTFAISHSLPFSLKYNFHISC